MYAKQFRTRTDRTLCVLYVGTNPAANTTDSSHAKVSLADETPFTVIYIDLFHSLQ
jgi:anaerobic selenocysteine-containing dehydrogenase